MLDNLRKTSSHTSLPGVSLLVSCIAILMVALDGDVYLSQVCADILIAYCLALGMLLIFGHAGILDLGYIAFVAVGAYSYAFLSMLLNLPWCLCVLFAGILAAVFSQVIGVPTLRATGDYLAIVTLGFGEIVRITLQRTEQWTGGARGIVGVPHADLFGWYAVFPSQYCLVLLGFSIVLVFLYLRLARSRYEKFWRALRDNAGIALVCGIPRRRNLLFAFAAGAALAGVTGALSASRTGFLSPDSFTLFDSIYILVYVILVGHFYGTARSSRISYLACLFLASAGFVVLGEVFRPFQSLKPVVMGAAILVVMWTKSGILRPGVRAEVAHPEAPPAAHGSLSAHIRDLAEFVAHARRYCGDLSERRLGVNISVEIAGSAIVKAVQFDYNAERLLALSASNRSAHDAPVAVSGVTAIIGLNGAGKTTLFRGLLNQLKARGSVNVEWRDPRNVRDIRVAVLQERPFRTISAEQALVRGIFGYSLQTAGSLHMTLREYLETVVLASLGRYEEDAGQRHMPVVWLAKFPIVGEFLARRLWLRRLRRNAYSTIVLPYLAAAGMKELQDRWMPQLSLFEKRLADLMRILLLRPQILLLDEILAGLTAEEKDTMCALLTALNRECGVGILIIEHDIDAVRSLADSVLLLDQGRLVAEGATEAVLRSETYQHIYAGA